MSKKIINNPDDAVNEFAQGFPSLTHKEKENTHKPR